MKRAKVKRKVGRPPVENPVREQRSIMVRLPPDLDRALTKYQEENQLGSANKAVLDLLRQGLLETSIDTHTHLRRELGIAREALKAAEEVLG